MGACCAVAAVAGLVPTPVGSGPRYRPAAHGPTRADVACRPGPLRPRSGARVHLELFARRRVVIVPAGIGLATARLRFGRVESAACRAPLWTLDPSGVVRFQDGRTLGDLFAVWGRRLGPHRLLTFAGAVRVWVDGRPRAGDPRTLRLRDRDEVVLEVGGYVPPHASFRFPP